MSNSMTRDIDDEYNGIKTTKPTNEHIVNAPKNMLEQVWGPIPQETGTKNKQASESAVGNLQGVENTQKRSNIYNFRIQF